MADFIEGELTRLRFTDIKRMDVGTQVLDGQQLRLPPVILGTYAPGNGNGWIYLVSKLRAGLVANACRTVHGRARVAPAATPRLRKDRLVIIELLWQTILRRLHVICEILFAFCRAYFSEFQILSARVRVQSSVCLRFVSE